MKIVIAPFAQKLRNGKNNAKNYPYWSGLLELLEGHKIIQIGVKGEEQFVEDRRFGLPLAEIAKLLEETDLWISVDSFLPHLAHHIKCPGIVIFSKSDSNIFGYPENLNILKDRKYLRKEQFNIWEAEEFDPLAFLSAIELYDSIKHWLSSNR